MASLLPRSSRTSNRRVTREAPAESWRDRGTKVIAATHAALPASVQRRLPSSKAVGRVARIALGLVVGAWALVVVAGLLHAWNSPGAYRDRSAEVRGLESELASQVARRDRLLARKEALVRDEHVQVDAIRRELGMLRSGERFYVIR